ncbi:MAG TPA: thioredoxin family protein [Thermoanaerobaculia bacterium]|nr:thioredoxin family protein [Thermoanaerobaculia bacterium]
MNPLPDAVWSRRLSYPAYLESIQRHREVFDEVFRNPSYGPDDLAWLRTLPPLRLLVVAEDWCPDVFHTLPTWARLVEELGGWELGIFARDANPDVMAAFVWLEGKRRIPVYAFYHHDRLQLWWSGRGAAAERALSDLLAGRSFASLSPEEQRQAATVFEEGYRRDFRRQNLDEMLTLLRAFFHQPR